VPRSDRRMPRNIRTHRGVARAIRTR
jgi:hypothetical protein